MKSSFIIKKKIINMYDDKSEMLVYINEILNQIFDSNSIKIIGSENGKYKICCYDSKICYFTLDNAFNVNVLKIYDGDKIYLYYIKEKKSEIEVNLKGYNNVHKNINCYFMDNKTVLEVLNDSKYIHIEIDNKQKNMMMDLIEKINPDNSLMEIYNEFSCVIYNELAIKKNKIKNQSYTEKDLTDLLILKNNRLIEFKTTVIKEKREYIIKKTYGEYKVTCSLVDLDDFKKVNFDINENINFAKKLEKKK